MCLILKCGSFRVILYRGWMIPFQPGQWGLSSMNPADAAKRIPAVARPASLYLWTALVCLGALVIASLLGSRNVLVPTRYFLPLHLVLEYSSIVVSFAVFTVGWFGYRQTHSSRDLLIGVTFLSTGALDFVHTLSYQGMPDFLSTNTPGKAAAYWLLARLLVGVGILAAACLGANIKSRWLSAVPLLVTAWVIVAASIVLVTCVPSIGEAFFDSGGGGLTGLKLGLEYLIIVIYAAAFIAVADQQGWERDARVRLRAALIVAAFAEVSFTLYASPYSLINALGHALKTGSYYLILNALFASALYRPYLQLSAARDEMEALYSDAREHRREIETSFARIGSALSSSLNIDQALGQIAELAGDMLHADCAIVASVQKHGGAVRVAAQRGGCHAAHRPVDLTLEIGRQAIEQRTTIVENHLESTGLIECDFQDKSCLRSMICAPMIYEGNALGVVTIYSHEPEAFEDGDANLLEAFAAHAAVAVHNALSYQRESHIADVLQRSIVSPKLVRTERFEIAQVYEPAMDEALVGGDFYDIIEMPDSRFGLVIGDVSGKGLAAAVHTAMVKYALRAYVSEGYGPAQTLHRLNNMVSTFIGQDAFVTLFFGILDPSSSEFVYASAGHEPAIYSCNSHYETLPATGPALGFGAELGYTEESLTLEEGCVMLLYTDGISEARQSDALLGAEGIGEQVLACAALGSEDLAKCIHTAAVDFAGGELRDDAAILAVRSLDIASR